MPVENAYYLRNGVAHKETKKRKAPTGPYHMVSQPVEVGDVMITEQQYLDAVTDRRAAYDSAMAASFAQVEANQIARDADIVALKAELVALGVTSHLLDSILN